MDTPFRPDDARVLKMAYDEALAKVASEDGVPVDVRAKLAGLVFDIGRMQRETGVDLRRVGHSTAIADVAVERLLRSTAS